MGGTRKKNTAKRKAASNPPKFTVLPASPAVTRAGASKKNSGGTPVVDIEYATPTQLPPPSQAASSGPSATSEISALERKFDDRMSRLETSFRSSITEMAAATRAASSPHHSVAAINVAAAVEPPPPPPPAPAVEPAVQASKNKAASRSSSSSSTSSVDSSDSDSSRSSSSSRSRSRSPSRRRRHHRTKKRHSRRHSRSSSRPKHSKYSSARYLKENEKVKNYSRLVLVNVRMALALLKRKKNIKSLLKHMLLVAEKADSDTFMDDVLISYDESIKELAKEEGVKAFKKVDPAILMKHLCYDGTKAAAAAKRLNTNKKAPASKGVQSVGHCLKFNYDPRGCMRGKDCYYKHVCSACGSGAHGNPDCPGGNRPKQK